MGLSRMVARRDGASAGWTPAYGGVSDEGRGRNPRERCREKERSAALSVYGHLSLDIGDESLCRVARSLLAAAFLKGDDGDVAIALLEGMELPVPGDWERKAEDGWPWFRAFGACLDSGYPFELDKPWNNLLIEIGTVIYIDHDVCDGLQRGWDLFTEKLPSSAATFLNTQQCKILVFCALFDDCLEGGGTSSLSSSRKSSSFLDVSTGTGRGSIDASFDQDDDVDMSFDTMISSSLLRGSLDETPSDLEGLERVAAFRELLWSIGESALSLCVSSNLHHEWQDAASGDVRLVLSSVTSDEVLAYVMAKNGLHECMYDRDAKDVSIFLDRMVLADKIGSGNGTRAAGGSSPAESRSFDDGVAEGIIFE
uniref:Uncharacterized protein n=1 Tax=Odontella aurita TaxID=265563 RepID=A0A6U6D1J6_9STRA|mmetsp:Transcript_17227/g.49967  ORF Transcript_17227/g.49967 Transcript_17227/m.49967 type:complete len:368 (+) Transcript_17227:1851-2954(+)